MIPFVPIWVRFVAGSAIVVAAFGIGYVRGVRSEADRYTAAMTGIASAGAAQTAKAEAIIEAKKEIAKENSNDYQTAAAHAASRHAAVDPRRIGAIGGGLRIPANHPSSGAVPDDPAARSGPNENAGGNLPNGPCRAPEEEVIQHCTNDVLRLLWLQDYVNRVCVSPSQ